MIEWRNEWKKLALMVGAFLVLLLTLAVQGESRPELQWGLTSDGLRWGLFPLVNLFCAPFTDAMQWERANLSIRYGYGMRPFIIAGAVFGAYLAVSVKSATGFAPNRPPSRPNRPPLLGVGGAAPSLSQFSST